MRSRRILAGAAAMAALVLGSAEDVEAEPTFWDALRDPETVHAYQVWLGAERALDAVEAEYWTREIHKRTHEDCAEKIQLWGGAETREPRLMFLFGQCLVSSERGYEERGLLVLRSALEIEPDSQFAPKAWAFIGIAAKRVGDRLGELEAYTRALEIEWDPLDRGVLFLRRGQASMIAGNLPQAIADFRVSSRDSTHPAAAALAEWALAVALDRSYDLPAALPHAATAAAVRTGPAGTMTALDLEWFDLEPRYEVHYYRALAHLAHAEKTTDEADLVGSLEAAQALFLGYTKAAAPRDPWVPRAKEHIERLQGRITALLARAQEP
jgi:tetratricopeptide (TPR) repeat protein